MRFGNIDTSNRRLTSLEEAPKNDNFNKYLDKNYQIRKGNPIRGYYDYLSDELFIKKAEESIK